MELIDKAALVAEIENIEADAICQYKSDKSRYAEGGLDVIHRIKHLLDTLEVKEVDTWHLQEKEGIYDSIKDWGLYTFACVMKDWTIQKFTGNLDEDCEGHINVHINGVNDDYDNVDDIVKWIEIT